MFISTQHSSLGLFKQGPSVKTTGLSLVKTGIPSAPKAQNSSDIRHTPVAFALTLLMVPSLNWANANQDTMQLACYQMSPYLCPTASTYLFCILWGKPRSKDYSYMVWPFTTSGNLLLSRRWLLANQLAGQLPLMVGDPHVSCALACHHSHQSTAYHHDPCTWPPYATS